MKRTSDT